MQVKLKRQKNSMKSKTYLYIAVLMIGRAKLDDKNKECFENIFSFVSDAIKD